MKKILRYSLTAVLLVILASSCQKEVALRKQVVTEYTLDTALTAGESYLLDLSPYGDEGDEAKIAEKPAYAATSKIENESDMFTSVYHYASQTNASGKSERITLLIHHVDSSSTAIYLNIAIR